MTVTSKRKAWQAADALMPTDYETEREQATAARVMRQARGERLSLLGV